MSSTADGGTKDWSNPGYASTDNGSYASIGTGAGTSYTLRATKFGFSIPAGSTIDGIFVEIKKWGYRTPRDVTVKLIIAGSSAGDNKAVTGSDWPSSLAYVSYGSVSDKWGLTPTVDQVNATDFGVGIQASNGSGLNGFLRVDAFRITITYTAGGGGVVIPVMMHHYKLLRE